MSHIFFIRRDRALPECEAQDFPLRLAQERLARQLARSQLQLLESDWTEELMRERKASRTRMLWVRFRVRLLRRPLKRLARKQARRALEFWHRASTAQPAACVEHKARWCAVYALAESSRAQRERLAQPLAQVLSKLAQAAPLSTRRS